MLNPENRIIYLEEIRPPLGYKLDKAVATTYSLDLLSLLMAPLSLALFDADNREEILKDPIAVLEAIRRTADKLAIFCQQGRIKVPGSDTKLFSYLEKIVCDVQPPGEGVFHPKVWILRFSSDNKPVIYRFLCFSRNLTFDNSWDTVLRLEGELEDDRVYGFSRNRPLADFIKELPELAVNNVNNQVSELIDQIGEEIIKVRFKPPENFADEISFIPSGINGYRKIPEFKDYTRLMVVSPFISDSLIKHLFNKGKDNILISRGESLDELNNNFISELTEKASVFILDDTAERPEEVDEEYQEDDAEDFSGLHTKLYILEKGWDARILTGSANTTNAAFSGNNVEFTVELTGKKSRIGIDPFLGIDEDQTTFRDLLKYYQRPEEEELDTKIRVQLERNLEQARKQLVKCGLSVLIKENYDHTYSLIINPEKKPEFDNLDIEGYCYPITVNENNKREIAPFITGKPVIFSDMSLVGLTGFIAFKLKMKLEDEEASTGFVLNLPVQGMPEERNKRILQNIIKDSDRFIRYLLFLLADEKDSTTDLINIHKCFFNGSGEWDTLDLPVLEELVRAYSRNPGKLENIKKLIDDLCQTEEGEAILPEGFDEVWNAVMEASAGREENEVQTGN